MDLHLRVFMEENPHLKLLTEASAFNQKILNKAEVMKYIKMQRSPTGIVFYSEENLEQAKMWYEKGCLNEVGDERGEHDD